MCPRRQVFEAGEGRLSDTVLLAIDHALAVHPEHRPRSVAEWRAELLGEAEIPLIAPAAASAAFSSEVAPDVPTATGRIADEPATMRST